MQINNGGHVKTKKTFLTGTFALVGAFVVTFLAFSLNNPVGESHAEAGCSDPEDYSCELEVNLNLNSTISITTNINTVPIEILPSRGGTTGSNSVIVTVITNNATGYYLQLNSKTANTALTQTDVADTIPSISADTTLANFAANRWGYILGTDTTGSFHQIPALGSPDTIRNDVDHAPTTDAERNTTVTFGTKVDTTIHTGTYENTLVFTAYKNS